MATKKRPAPRVIPSRAKNAPPTAVGVASEGTGAHVPAGPRRLFPHHLRRRRQRETHVDRLRHARRHDDRREAGEGGGGHPHDDEEAPAPADRDARALGPRGGIRSSAGRVQGDDDRQRLDGLDRGSVRHAGPDDQEDERGPWRRAGGGVTRDDLAVCLGGVGGAGRGGREHPRVLRRQLARRGKIQRDGGRGDGVRADGTSGSRPATAIRGTDPSKRAGSRDSGSSCSVRPETRRRCTTSAITAAPSCIHWRPG